MLGVGSTWRNPSVEDCGSSCLNHLPSSYIQRWGGMLEVDVLVSGIFNWENSEKLVEESTSS
jgi:hypothetical protein